MPMLIGNLVSILGGAVLSVAISYVTNRNMTEEEMDSLLHGQSERCIIS